MDAIYEAYKAARNSDIYPSLHAMRRGIAAWCEAEADNMMDEHEAPCGAGPVSSAGCTCGSYRTAATLRQRAASLRASERQEK